MSADGPASENVWTAEQHLLAALMRRNDLIADVVHLVHADSFRQHCNAKIFEAIVWLWQRGEPVDEITVANVLHGRDQIKELGGYGYLADLKTTELDAASAVHHAR